MDNQITYNEALIDERDQGIAEISQQIGEVNEIFQVSSTPLIVLAHACAQAGRQAVLCCADPGIHCPCKCLLRSRCCRISGYMWHPAWHCTARLHGLLSLGAHAIPNHLAVPVFDQCLMLVDIEPRTEEVFWNAWCNI